MIFSCPTLSHLIIAISFMFAYMLVADYVHLKTRFAMKKFLAWLFLRPFDIVFLMRLRSIERHIDLAVDKVSFDILRTAQSRIDFEFKYNHTQKERYLISLLGQRAEFAEQTIKNILIIESFDDHLLSKYKLQ